MFHLFLGHPVHNPTFKEADELLHGPALVLPLVFERLYIGLDMVDSIDGSSITIDVQALVVDLCVNKMAKSEP